MLKMKVSEQDWRNDLGKMSGREGFLGGKGELKVALIKNKMFLADGKKLSTAKVVLWEIKLQCQSHNYDIVQLSQTID